MKILLDCFGADNDPKELIYGAVLATKECDKITPVLCGDKEIILSALKSLSADPSAFEILDAKQVVTNDDSPTDAFKTKKDSSLIKGFEQLSADPDAHALISAGSTGAILTGATFIIKRLKGVLRPTLVPTLPTTKTNRFAIADSGANVDCKPEYLVQFAIMASAYMTAVYGIDNPRVALVSIGAEDKKGNELTKAAFELLKNSPVNFVGNVEARYAMSGDIDVFVCDGFVGNVLLKSIEGTAKAMGTMIKEAAHHSFCTKIGALFMKKGLTKMKQKVDYQGKGGAPLLGLNKVVIKCHGTANAATIKSAFLQAKAMVDSDLIQTIGKRLDFDA
ncbi:MAG: phosphate acyltransferase PlsX [Firmicutes bacterium]|nr:phosphate acyltransferase PlsX [Bacillota bacterium]